MSAAGRRQGGANDADDARDAPLTFDRHLVLEQLGGWRGMADATGRTVAIYADEESR